MPERVGRAWLEVEEYVALSFPCVIQFSVDRIWRDVKLWVCHQKKHRLVGLCWDGFFKVSVSDFWTDAGPSAGPSFMTFLRWAARVAIFTRRTLPRRTLISMI